MRNVAACALLCLALAGCANLNSIKHDFKVTNGDSISIDAKQRTIVSVNKAPPGEVPWMAVCAEPSPDALAAISASAGIDASVLNKAIGVAFGIQEGAASIGLRTQTIQILRDAMYRLCEGYASGALDEIGYARLQRRYQNIMLGLLAIEQLTGVTVASQVSIQGSESAKLGQSLSQVTSLVQDARSAVTAAQLSADGAKAAVATSTKERDAAKAALDAAVKAAGSNGETQEVKDAKAALAQKESALGEAKLASDKKTLELAQAKKEVESLESVRQNLERAAATASTTSTFNTPTRGGLTAPADPSGIATAVKEIVIGIVAHDYTKETCLDTLMSRAPRALTAKDGNLEALKLAMRFCAVAMEESAVSRATASSIQPSKDLSSLRDASKAFTQAVEALPATTPAK